MDTRLEVPMWVKDLLGITEVIVYINPNDNTQYVVYDTAEEMVARISDNTWVSVDYNKSAYEPCRTTIYQPLNEEFYRKTQPSGVSRVPFRSINEVKKRKPLVFDTTTTNSSRPKPKRRRIAGNHDVISLPAFINYFTKMPERPDTDLLCKVYELLNGFKITDQVLDVVAALVQFVSTQSLENTMSFKKRSKTFKAQLSYLLDNIQDYRNDKCNNHVSGT